MKYIIRALKYFVYIFVLMSLVLGIMVALGLVSSDINVMFRNGYKSLGQIAIMFFCVACFYPRFGFTKKGAVIPGEYKEIRDDVVKYMEDHKYVLESEQDENMTFRHTSTLSRLLKMYEDRITLTRDYAGFYFEGLTKDVVRLANGIEFKFRTPKED